MRILRKTVFVLAMSFNALTAAYYVWAAIADGAFKAHSFSSEAMPFTLAYFGRGLTPMLAVIALAWLGTRHDSNRS